MNEAETRAEHIDPALKERLKKEGNETVTDCHAFKMTAADGKQGELQGNT